MNKKEHYFFCGIGGSGMLPLAVILKAMGHAVEGSDRALDQGRLGAKFSYLESQGIHLHPQDGSGFTQATQILVTSTAVEETIPDVKAARNLGARHMTRAELLAQLFNAASKSIGIAGTSGKSTTTGMIGWILHHLKEKPTVMNGAVMKNFVSDDAPFASAAVGDPDLFVSEVDESDGSIALFSPTTAVLNNMAFDHKPLDELRPLFRKFVDLSDTAVLNLDNGETAAIATDLPSAKSITYSLGDPAADLLAKDLRPHAQGISFQVVEKGQANGHEVNIQMPGAHNVSNALAALGAAISQGISLAAAAEALGDFQGIKRRLELIGSTNGVTIIDDFAHNPDKITASLATLHDFPGRLIVMFQPHGFGPLRLMKEQFIDCFATGLNEQDTLIMPEPVYYGGTVDRSVGSESIATGILLRNRKVFALQDREACGKKILGIVQKGDRVVIMGARDDTLSDFAREILRDIAL